MASVVPAEPATDVLPAGHPLPPRHARTEGLSVAGLLDLLEEPPAERPAPTPIRRRIPVVAAAVEPRAAAAGRRLAAAASVAALVVLVPLAALLVVTAERSADALTAADLPGRARIGAGRARCWSRRVIRQLRPVRDRLTEDVRTRGQRAAQWVLGPLGTSTAWPAQGGMRSRPDA